VKKVIFACLALFAFIGAVLAQEVVPPQVNPPRNYQFQLVVILTHVTGNQSALYFISIDKFDDQEYCQKRMYKSAAQFEIGIKRVRQLFLKSVNFFGNCQLLGVPQDMMFPLEFPKEKPNDGKVLPQ
jgi:hypothetical protein